MQFRLDIKTSFSIPTGSKFQYLVLHSQKPQIWFPEASNHQVGTSHRSKANIQVIKPHRVDALAFLYDRNLGSKSLRERSQKFFYSLGLRYYLHKVNTRVQYITKLKMECRESLILLHPNALKFGGQHLDFRQLHR